MPFISLYYYQVISLTTTQIQTGPLAYFPSQSLSLVSTSSCRRCASMRYRSVPCSAYLSSSPKASPSASRGKCFCPPRQTPALSQFNMYLTTPFFPFADFLADSYGLITEQRKGAYRYFADLGDRMEVATSRTSYVDEARPLARLLYIWNLRINPMLFIR